MLEKIKKYLNFEYLSVSVILVISFILRVFRVDQILAFHYDQGRDALVIWDLIHSHKFFLIGPTTGLAGIFRGPFYYYLIAPFYWLGDGNPVVPAIMLAVLSVVALGLMYYLACKIGGKSAGIIALILGAFSFEIIYAGRWLSNPTPMLLLSMVLVWCLFKILDQKEKTALQKRGSVGWVWIILSFVLGLSFFHFGSSGELFYFPAILIFAIYFKKFPNVKTLFISIGVFLLTLLPLFLFNLKHGGILQNNIAGLLSSGNGFTLPAWQFVHDRLKDIGIYFSILLFRGPTITEWIHIFVILFVFILFLPGLIKNSKLKVLLILLGSVTLGALFFQGNNGNFYQYYLTGYYLIFLLLAALPLAALFDSNWIGKTIVIYILFLFIFQNWSWTKSYLQMTGEEPDKIVLSNQKLAIDWLYKNAGSRDFNVDVYVPPVISYSYDYLFKWLGTTKYHKLSVDSQVPLLYTLYEVDPPHPERLGAWLDRQKGIGKVISEETFGGVIVQERERIIKK